MRLYRAWREAVDAAEFWGGYEADYEGIAPEPNRAYRLYNHYILPIPGMKWLDVRVYSAYQVLRFAIGELICEWRGHSDDTDVADFVSCERDERGRITDIDGGGVDWYCPRCGHGGRSWF